MEHHGALLLRALDLDEPHRRPGNRLADCLGIRSIILLALHIGLDVIGGISRASWPSFRSSRPHSAPLHTPPTRRGMPNLCKEPQYLASTQTPLNNDIARGIDTMKLKD